MKTSNNITLTNGRTYRPLKLLVNKVIDERGVEETINKTVDASKLRTGIVKKVYLYLDKVEVQLTNITKPVLCVRLHRLGGSLIDFYTPDGDLQYCENLQEPYIAPREELHVLVADISNEDRKEMLLLGYFNPEDIVGIKPANPGYFKITNIGATNTWGIEMGNGEINVSTMDGVKYTEGEFHADDTIIDYVNSRQTYTKTEVDALLVKMKEEILSELQGGEE